MSLALLTLLACDKSENDGIDCTVTTTFFKDDDGDGFGDEDKEVEACLQAEGLVLNEDDCDDSNPDIHPDADEICDPDDVDEDCDRDSDDEDNGVEEDGYRSWYVDNDDDGHPDLDSDPVEACDEPEDGNYARGSEDDCDDDNAEMHPDAQEVCDGYDNDCDGFTDDDDLSLDTSTATTWYLDGDGDGYAAAGAETSLACDRPGGYTDAFGDCDDFDSAIRPGATEQCNGVDDDCDGSPDPDEIDGDGDGYSTCEGDIDDTDETVVWDVVSHAVGGDALDYFVDGRFRGLRYEAAADTRLHSFDMLLDPDGACDIDAYVLSASDEDGPYTEEWSGVVTVTPGLGYVGSGDVGPIELIEGRFYALGFAFPCPVTAFGDYTEEVGSDFGVGELYGLLYDNTYTEGDFSDALSTESPIFDMINHVSAIE